MIDTNKARRYAEDIAGDRDYANIAALLFSLADAHDAMVQALERIRNEPYTRTVDARMIAHQAMQRGKDG